MAWDKDSLTHMLFVILAYSPAAFPYRLLHTCLLLLLPLVVTFHMFVAANLNKAKKQSWNLVHRAEGSTLPPLYLRKAISSKAIHTLPTISRGLRSGRPYLDQMSSAWPWNNMPNGPSKLRHMESALSSSSSSSEASDRPPRQRQVGGRHTPRSQSANAADRIETVDTAEKGGKRLSTNITSVREDGRSAESGYEAGDEAKSAARPGENVQGGRDADTGDDVQGPAESDMRRIAQGSQLSTNHRFRDSNGNVDVDAIQDDDIRDPGLVPVSPSSRAGSHLQPGHGQSASITGSAASTRRRREDDEDDDHDEDWHDQRNAKRPRVEGA